MARHGRAHLRHHRQRVIDRRWKQAKDHHGYWSLCGIHPEECRPPSDRTLPSLLLPEEESQWPFSKARNQFARNPFNQCSCGMCSRPVEFRRADRRRSERLWREIEDAAWTDGAVLRDGRHLPLW